MNDRGSLAILISGYLALIITLFVGGYAVALGLIAQNRIQGVADSALLYAHDRAVTKGIPNQEKLDRAIVHFLDHAPSAKQLVILSIDSTVAGVKSTILLCARHQDPIGQYLAGKICRQASAESFLVN
jgi:predicted benzoate:H+ symporter BenE